MTTAWTVADKTGDNIARHFDFTADGFDAAAVLASQHRYCVWQSFGGEPRYLMWKPRS